MSWLSHLPRPLAMLLVATLVSGLLAACQKVDPIRHVQIANINHQTSQVYVALGDSYTSAPLVSGLAGSPVGCLRSNADYPALVAAALRASVFRDVSCYGASTIDMTKPQRTLVQVNPPQLAALSAADTIVTIQVGGDDIGFSHAVMKCGILSLTDPMGAPCRNYYTSAGTDELAAAIARTQGRIAAVLRGIRARAPHARILLVGYPDILPVTGNGCWPEVPIASGDIPYVRTVERELNTMLADTAASSGDIFVDTYASSIGHDACSHSKWLEGLIPTSPAVPFHPNALGEAAMARDVLAKLR